MLETYLYEGLRTFLEDVAKKPAVFGRALTLI